MDIEVIRTRSGQQFSEFKYLTNQWNVDLVNKKINFYRTLQRK